MKLLLVEDDQTTAAFIQKGFAQAGFSVAHVADGLEARSLARAEEFDAAVVDIMLPGLDGISLIRSLRSNGVHLPILVLSARNSVDDKVRGLEAGGDDYLAKPFAFSELLARVHALVRRANAQSEPTTITVAGLTMDLIRHRVFHGESELQLQPREYALLAYLMRNAGRVVSKTMIVEHVWEYNFDPETNVVEARISRLRNKLHGVTNEELIHTVRGVGYVLDARD